MHRLSCLLVILLFLVAAAGCSRLEPPEEKGELVVGIRVSPAYYQGGDAGDTSGFEHDLVELFGRELSTPVRFAVARDPAELMTWLKEGRIHFAAAAPLAETEGVRYSTPLRETDQVLVQHADAPLADQPGDLAGKTIDVLAGSAQAKALRLLTKARRFLLREQEDMTEVELLERVSQGKSELAATDLGHFNIARNYFPNLQLAQELAGSTRFAWAFAQDGDARLFERAQAFLARIRGDGTLARIQDRYLSRVRRINRAGVSAFLERMGTVLPHYRREFIAAQELTGLDWRLLAALAYQESMWDPLATSPTGVRGMMMLTGETADRLGVENRLDPRQSIRAGARYLADLIEQLPAAVKEPDRTWLALAAYNLGNGHLNGARAIARGLQRDPDSWYEMKQVLPLISRPEYYSRLKSGAGRGGEAVIMVENVRTFYDILKRFERNTRREYLPR